MKKSRLILAASLLSFGAFSTVLTSCSDDEPCNLGYEGSDCKTLSRDKFIGAWKGTETCTIGEDEYTITITAGSTGDLNVVMTNVYNDNYTATGTITGSNSFRFDGSAAGNVSFDGTAIYEAGTSTLRLNYTVEDGVLSNSCNFSGQKL